MLGALAATPASALGDDYNVVRADLNPLNNSGVVGNARVNVDGRILHVDATARGLLRNMPHAMHIHHGDQATHECPTVRLDKNRDFRLNTAEGIPAYGPIAVSLTTPGDTSPASGLAVDRFPTTPTGRLAYHRDITVSSSLAAAVARGEGVVVIHGIDYNNNGKYDFNGAGKSELDGSLPAEATDPVTCGRLR